jgi:hypothetical protein
MEIFPVASDLTIELDDANWRLVQDFDGGKSMRTLVEADAAHLKFHDAFLQAHNLPASEIDAEQVARVVLGWTPESKNWHLGLFLNNNPSTNGSELMWCELATFFTSTPGASESSARSVGAALGHLLNSPFQVVDANAQANGMSFSGDITQPSMGTIRVSVRPVALQPLPLDIGDWTLRQNENGMTWQLSGGWRVRHGVRIVFFTIAALAFIMLGYGTLTSGLAPVSPEWLPFVSFGIAFVLLFSALENIWTLLTMRRIVVDDLRREVRCERVLVGVVDWRASFDEVEYLLLSQNAAQPQGRRSREDPMQISHDAWLHLYTGHGFQLLTEHEDVAGQSWQWELIRRRDSSEGRLHIDLSEYDTPLHHAVKHMADRLSVAAYIDHR